VIQWSEFLAIDPEVPGSINGATRFSEKQWVWKGVQLNLVNTTGVLQGRNSSGSGLESREYGRRDPSS
jgi:hypothetical protein